MAGKTKRLFWKLLIYSVEGIIAFSTVPLSIAAVIGVLLCVIAIIIVVIIVIKTLIFGDPVSGWPSLTCIIIFIGGMQLFSIAILRQYLSKTYLETKKMPIYIVKEQNIYK